MFVQCSLKVSTIMLRKDWRSLLHVPEASAPDNAEFFEAEQKSEVELGVVRARDLCLLLLELGDFSKIQQTVYQESQQAPCGA
jgi:hypothetical protein